MKYQLQPKTNTDRLFVSLLWIALISIGAVLFLACYGTYRTYSSHITMVAENDSTQISLALMHHEQAALLTGDLPSGFRIGIDPRELPRLDVRLREFLQPFGILKIKIYDENRTIVYSTDREIIGMADRGNPHLIRALAGFNDSRLERKEKVQDLAEEQRIGVDVVETYVPIRDMRGKVIGAFEIYLDVTAYKKNLHSVVLATFVMLLAVLLLVSACSYLVLRKIVARLREAEAELQRMAITDPLTGIANRRQIMHRVNEEFARHLRKRREGVDAVPLGIIMLDVDLFKNINDTHGHAVGDAVLKEVSARIVHCLRPYDLVGRFGGEEFLVMLPETELQEVWRVAERIRTFIAGEPVRNEGVIVPITASLGVASLRNGERDCGAALKRADKGLYQAKIAGRNQVACVDEAVEETAAS